MKNWKIPKRFFRQRFSACFFPRFKYWGRLAAGFSGYGAHISGRALSPGPSKSFAIHYVLSGRSWYLSSRNRKQEIQAGEFFVNFPGRFTSPTIPNASRDFLQAVLILDPQTYDLCRSCGSLGVLPRFGRVGVLSRLATGFDRLIGCVESVNSSGSNDRDIALSRALVLIANIRSALADYTSTRESRGPLHIAAAILSSEPKDRTTIPDIARKIGMSYESFRKRFREQIGISPQEYRLRYRMEAATKFLSAGNNVQTVANQVGYSDPFAFSKAFQKHTGISPVVLIAPASAGVSHI